MTDTFPYIIPEGIEERYGFFITNSLDKTYKKLAKIVGRVGFRRKRAYASDQSKVWHGSITTESGKSYVPSLKPITTALKQRVINIFDTYTKTTRILMLDIDATDSQFAWYYAGLPQPFTVTTNPKSGKCQYWYLLDCDYGKDELYRVRDTMLNALQSVLKIKIKKGEHGLDYSKPENVRSPFFDPFYVRIDTETQERVTLKRVNSTLVKDGKAQADYAEIIVADEFRTWSLADLMIKTPNLDEIDFAASDPVISLNVGDIKTLPRKRSRGINMAGSVGLFDALRVACYPLYSNKALWSLEKVISLARELASGEAETKIIETAKDVFEWINVEFVKSHDPAKAGNGGGSRRANYRWQREREDQECECLSDFADREGFSRQHASKLKKAGKLCVDGGHFHFVWKMMEDQLQYVKEITSLTKNNKQKTTISMSTKGTLKATRLRSLAAILTL